MIIKLLSLWWMCVDLQLLVFEFKFMMYSLTGITMHHPGASIFLLRRCILVLSPDLRITTHVCDIFKSLYISVLNSRQNINSQFLANFRSGDIDRSQEVPDSFHLYICLADWSRSYWQTLWKLTSIVDCPEDNEFVMCPSPVCRSSWSSATETDASDTWIFWISENIQEHYKWDWERTNCEVLGNNGQKVVKPGHVIGHK